MGTDPLLDEIVDRRFRIIKRLGTGGMGSVYLAEHLTLGRKFAIKVLREEFNEQPEFLARFLRESRAAMESLRRAASMAARKPSRSGASRTTSANRSISGVGTDTTGLPVARYSRSFSGLALRTCWFCR